MTRDRGSTTPFVSLIIMSHSFEVFMYMRQYKIKILLFICLINLMGCMYVQEEIHVDAVERYCGITS